MKSVSKWLVKKNADGLYLLYLFLFYHLAKFYSIESYLMRRHFKQQY